MKKTTSQDVIKIVWKACDTFRGTMDSSKYKDYILTMLFVKYVSDFYKEKLEELKAKFGDNEDRIQKSLKREKFQLDSTCTFDVIYENRNAEDIGEIINKILMRIEDDNKEKLEGIFRNIDFNSEAELGRTKERNATLKHLIEDFADASLDLRPSVLDGSDVIGDAYEFLIANFASDAGKKGGEFYTPGEVSTLLAKLVGAKDGDRIYDPTCGSGSLLIKAAKEVGTQNFRLYGQERNGQTQALANMNMFLHEINDAVIEWGDTLRNPLHLENERLMKFDKIVSNPPFSLDKWGAEDLANDTYGRFQMGLPPKSKGDFAFISHMLASLNENGTAGIILPHGILFRGGSEGKIRKSIVENNWLDAIIGLPENLFFGADITTCIIILKKNRVNRDIVFIDASNEYLKDVNQYKLTNKNIDKIVDTYVQRKEIEKYSHLATIDEIRENNYNLNISRYIDKFIDEEEIDVISVKEGIIKIDMEIDKINEEIKKLENNILNVRKKRKWPLVRLSEIFERITDKNTTECTNVLTISAQYGLINQEEFFNKSVSSKDLSNYYLLKKGDFAYNKSYSKGYPLGAIKRLNNYTEGVVSPLYICFRAKKEINSDFYEQYFESGALNRAIFKIAQEGARNHGLLNISITEFFSDIKIAYPSLSEQNEIANILINYDKEIRLVKSKLDNLLLHKKGLMQLLLAL